MCVVFSDLCCVFRYLYFFFICLCCVLQVCVVILDCILCFTYLPCVLHICIVFCISVLCFVCLCCVLYVCVVCCMFVLCFVFVGHRSYHSSFVVLKGQLRNDQPINISYIAMSNICPCLVCTQKQYYHYSPICLSLCSSTSRLLSFLSWFLIFFPTSSSSLL